jgi:hypothetical protein
MGSKGGAMLLKEYQKEEIRKAISFLEDFVLSIVVWNDTEEDTAEWELFDSTENNLYGAISDLSELLRL